jgi:carboxymethylenebutenolidase
MKKLMFLIAVYFLIIQTIPASAQNSKSCCSTASAEFAMLGSDAKFQAAHLSPEPIHFIPSTGKDITFPASDGKDARAFYIKSEKPTNKYLLVVHEWWGLNDHIKKESERLANELNGVNVIAVDLYDGMLATNAEEAGRMMQMVKAERAESIIRGALNYAGKDAQFQTIGWCFGGAWSLQASILAGKNSVGCVMYYGTPEKDMERIKMLNAPVLGIFASKDTWITKEIVDKFESDMKAAGKQITIQWYDADHAFANPSNPKHDKVATEDANKLALQFLKQNFNIK